MDRRDDKIETLKEDTKDTLDEAKHRVAAGGEKVKRAVEGDSMPLGEKIASNLKEAGHNVKADYDRAKRDVRDGDA
ncbi:MAG TPA: hypothetical protein VGX96_15225 [Candidatus Elarobacter sp.]|jgi:hypothetical protein|nr:hypothetical protein [Candidatus Elarobacter sp.]